MRISYFLIKMEKRSSQEKVEHISNVIVFAISCQKVKSSNFKDFLTILIALFKEVSFCADVSYLDLMPFYQQSSIKISHGFSIEEVKLKEKEDSQVVLDQMRLPRLLQRDSVDAFVASVNALATLSSIYSRGTVEEDSSIYIIQTRVSIHTVDAYKVDLKVILLFFKEIV